MAQQDWKEARFYFVSASNSEEIITGDPLHANFLTEMEV